MDPLNIFPGLFLIIIFINKLQSSSLIDICYVLIIFYSILSMSFFYLLCQANQCVLFLFQYPSLSFTYNNLCNPCTYSVYLVYVFLIFSVKLINVIFLNILVSFLTYTNLVTTPIIIYPNLPLTCAPPIPVHLLRFGSNFQFTSDHLSNSPVIGASRIKPNDLI